MTGLAPVIVTPPLLEDDDLLALGLRNDLGRDRYLGWIGDILAIAGQQDVAQRDGIARFSAELFDCYLVSGGNPVLLAACAHYREHGLNSLFRAASDPPQA